MGKQEEIKVNEIVKIHAQHRGIYQALASAQIAMGPALKDSTNPAFKSKYADLASVMAACLPALNANGIAVIQPPIDDESGARFVKTILAHEGGETLEFPELNDRAADRVINARLTFTGAANISSEDNEKLESQRLMISDKTDIQRWLRSVYELFDSVNERL